MGSLRDWFEMAREIVFSPRPFFRKVKGYDGLTEPLIFAAISGVVVAVLLRLVAGVIALTTGDMALPAVLITVAVGAVLGAVGGAIGPVLGGAITHIGVYILGGRGIGKTIRAQAFSTAVSAFFGWIPLVNVAAAFYALYVFIVGVSESHDFSTGRAVAAVFLPGIVAALLVGGAAVSLVDSGAFDPCQTVPPSNPEAPVVVTDWAATEPGEAQIAFQAASGQPAVTQATIEWESGQTWTWTGNTEIGPLGNSIVLTGDPLPGDCARGTLTVTINGQPTDFGTLEAPLP